MNVSPASNEWLATIRDVRRYGEPRAPRGQRTLDLPQHTMAVDMMHPVVNIPERKLGMKFMAAEAAWILSGDDRVETIAPYNANIAQFSDDGVRFFGAYGPKIVEQLDYVVAKLKEDPATRQAGLTLWRENPPPTKDVPCTIAMFFSLVGTMLNAHVFMRSSDVWLGVPYDVFNFSMVAMKICAELNGGIGVPGFQPGTLYLTAASRHLYGRNLDDAVDVYSAYSSGQAIPTTGPVPRVIYTKPGVLMDTLVAIRDGDRAARWWEHVP